MTKQKRNYGKWIGGGLGWAIGGPIGALFGFFAGSLFDGGGIEVDSRRINPGQYRHQTGVGDFQMSLVILAAAVMKADKSIKKSELEYVKAFFIRQFGVESTKEQMLALRDVLQQEIPVRQVCEQIRFNMQHPLRLQLIHFLFGISQADGHVHADEVREINRIAHYLGISQKDFESIKAMFYGGGGARGKRPTSTVNAYKILEIDKSATDAEVKKAYRKMALKFHPDKVTTLGAEFKRAAKEKFQKVQDAYETIKDLRGFN